MMKMRRIKGEFKPILRLIKLAILLVVVSNVVIAASIAFYVVTRWQGESLVRNAEVEYTERLKAEIGKPQIIEQHYVSPNK